MSGLRRSATMSALWAALETGSLSVLAFLVLLVMARILSPADFGVAAIALSIVQIVAAIGECLFHDAIVQRPGLTARETAAAHTVTILLGLALTALVMAGAPLIEALFAAPGLAPLVFWMAPSILFTALGAVPVALLRRNLEFRNVALRMICGRAVGGIAAFAAAFAGLGVWSLVLQQVATSAFACLALFLLGSTAATTLPGIASPRASAPLLRFAATTLAVNLMWGNVSRMFLIAASFVLTQSGVGMIALAMRFVDTSAAIIGGAQAKVALSLFSRMHRETGTVRKAYIAGSRLSSYIIVPLFAGLAVMAHDLVLALAGERWIEVVPLVQILAAGQAIRSLTLGGAVLTALGRPAANLAISVAELLAAILVLIALGPSGTAWVAAAWALRVAASLPAIVYLFRRFAGLGLGDLYAGVSGALFAGLAMVVVVLVAQQACGSLSLWVRLPLLVGLGAVAYAGVVWCIDRALFTVPRNLLAGKA